MPNKYSHALVLSYYHSRGLIKFPYSPPSSYVAPLPVESRLRVKPKSQTPDTGDPAPIDQPRLDQLRPDQSRPEPIRPEQFRYEQSRPDRSRPEPPRLEQPRPDQSRSEQLRPEPPRPEQSRSEQSRPEQSRSEQLRPEPPRPEQSRSEQSRSEQPRPDQSRSEQLRPDPPRSDQSRSEQPRPKQSRSEQLRPKQPRPEQPRPEQFRSSTPWEPDIAIEPTPSPRPTPSIITEIYDPDHRSSPPHNSRQSISPDPSLASLSLVYLDTEFEEDEFSIGTNSLTTSTSAGSSSYLRSTPRSSVSPIPESPILGPFEDFPPTRDLFPIIEDYATTQWEDLHTIPANFRLPSLDLSSHCQSPTPSPQSRSPSPHDAVPPPISRHRRVSSIPVTTSNRRSMASTKATQSGPYPEVATPRVRQPSNSDPLRGSRNLLGNWIMGSKLHR